jgi:oligoribonuclease (3'-5' exoribonuclease)
MKTIKKIYFDFETTSPNPNEAKILEATFTFVENKKIIKTFSKKINFYIDRNFCPKSLLNSKEVYDELTELEKDTLKFNKINNHKEMSDHILDSEDFIFFFDEILYYYKEFKGSDNKLSLTGWNNAGFDNVILIRYFPKLSNYFDYHTRDIYHNFRILKDFHKVKGLNLSKIHKELIGTFKDEDFHKSENDCIAVKDLDEWFESNIILQSIK